MQTTHLPTKVTRLSSLKGLINALTERSYLAFCAILASVYPPVSALANGYDIWLYPLEVNSNATQPWALGQKVAITNRTGYDNQPSFSADSQSLLFTSDRGSQHNDIYRYHIGNANLEQLTHTPTESEYSPQASRNGVRYVVEQGVPHQSVWQQTEHPDGWSPRERGIQSMIPSGYYATHEQLGTLIWARYAYSLYFEPLGASADERHFVVADAGRSIHVMPQQNAFSYLHKQPDGDRVIKRFEPISNTHQALISVKQGSEDYGWSSDGWIFNIEQQTLRAWKYQSQPNNNRWQMVTELVAPTPYHHSPSRVAISPDSRYIAIVWQRKEH
ncbi:hypothetical protein TUM3794_02620 [Shewanella colwelliana]|uniref:Uncharacterized protein n=1 Tax=Shewanella colwelliana TaxID=23 RepID=A0ABQ4NUD3_SHECO|nr:hypothetical protein [Shewanella colwelliana]GIU35237.1 hypothetical protein TUM3794_02620 [Shewanella colwelliana]